jgi:hypothetical protein
MLTNIWTHSTVVLTSSVFSYSRIPEVNKKTVLERLRTDVFILPVVLHSSDQRIVFVSYLTRALNIDTDSFEINETKQSR